MDASPLLADSCSGFWAPVQHASGLLPRLQSAKHFVSGVILEIFHCQALYLGKVMNWLLLILELPN